ncbi:unnamed protein product [Linum tenue]|uniref:Reticulon-like protein n=1 Tax=Linum tenue TaxID=586396 RepID=A0AAV0IA12_9ROSI|nr:unnamed protein product [Linum tenue]
MEVSGRRRSVPAAAAAAGLVNNNNSKPSSVIVAAGSVWESRMKLDEVKGGFKVFNADDGENPEPPAAVTVAATPRRSPRNLAAGTVASSGKRKTWKSESFEGPIRLSASADGVKKSPIQGRKLRSEGSGEGIARSPVQVSKKGRSEVVESSSVASPIQIGKVRSAGNSGKEAVNSPVKLESKVGGGGGKSDGEMKEAKSVPEKDLLEESVCQMEKEPSGIGETEESCREFGVCEEKVVSSAAVEDDRDDGDQEFEEEDEEEFEEESDEEIEKKSFDVKEVNVQEDEKPKEKKLEVKRVEIPIPEQKPTNRVVHRQFQNRAPPPAPPTVKKQPPPVMRRAAAYQNYTKPTPTPAPSPAQSRSYPRRQSKLQNLGQIPYPQPSPISPSARNSSLTNIFSGKFGSFSSSAVDLVMWRDVSRSAFVFGIGTFTIISSSYTQDLNISFISVMSYLGLVYLAAIFLYRTLISRGIVEGDDGYEDTGSYVVGEGEAICVVKLVLPYLNECLLRIKALFSGDPSTTMKLAVLLFVLARCGGYITIWKMAKLGFFGVFILPKVCSLYSSQLTSYAKFWIRRFRDAWEKCTHKKAVALGIFTLVWNMSSIVARVWAVFMMFVAVRYYQQRVAQDSENWEECDDDNEEEVIVGHDAKEEDFGPRRRPNYFEVNSKLKKKY